MANHFFQIFLSDLDENLPEVLNCQVSKFKQLYSDCDYQCFDRHSLRAFVADVYGDEVLKAYDCLRPLAYKADLGRYCLVYALGGWYADITLKPLVGLRLSEKIEMVYFYDFGSGLPDPTRSAHDVMNAFFFAKAGHPVLSQTIESILRNCRNQEYGLSALSVTGPTLLGRAIAQHAPSLNMMPGHFMPLTPFHQKQNRSFVTQDGTIAALHKSAWHDGTPGGGQLECFGLRGTNNYEWLWHQRLVFNTE